MLSLLRSERQVTFNIMEQQEHHIFLRIMSSEGLSTNSDENPFLLECRSWPQLRGRREITLSFGPHHWS